MSYDPDYEDKLIELQEALNELQLLRQLDGTEKLQKLHERKIVNLYQDLQRMNRDTLLSPIDEILPLKCRICPEKKTDEEKLQCYDEHGDSCTLYGEPIIPLNFSFYRVLLTAFGIIFTLIIFLLLTDILFRYISNIPIVFGGAVVITLSLIAILYKPIKSLYKRLGP